MKLKDMRASRGMSQRGLAKKMGKHQPWIALLEKNDLETASVFTVQEFCKALDCAFVITGRKVFFQEIT